MSELIIDNFAGGGGASTGIALALGRDPDYAINHDAEALEMHRRNHPETVHLCEDVFAIRPLNLCAGRPVGLAWFSPDCKHFSKAKGGRPVSKRVRGLAWVVIKWAEQVRPRIIALENVEEFTTWGPLGDDGRPDPAKAGITFKRWCGRLRNLGYRVEHRELVAADYGAPTTRRRLFVVARCDGQPITWPEPTHARVPGADLFAAGLLPWRTAAECIDWSIPCPSIFGRKRPLAENTLKRIAAGLRRYVIEAAQPFIVPIHHYSAGRAPVHSVHEPLRTITAKPDGGAFALCAPTLVGVGARAGQSPPNSVDEPLRTVVAKADRALVMAFLAKHYGGVVGHGIEQPIGTVTTVDHHSLVQAFLVSYYGQGIGQPLDAPARTITTKDRLGLVTVHGQQYEIADIGLRMLAPRELALAQGFPADYWLPASKSAAVRMIGNSVCPPLAEAIVRANYDQRAVEVAA